jgi:hypothetical protein
MKIFSTMTLMAALAAVPVFAQNKPMLRATVPFDFVVGKAVLPAGEYDVKAATNNETLLVRETAGSASAFVITNPTGAYNQTAETALVFRNIGDTHYLQTVKSSAGDRQLHNAPATGGTLRIIKAAIVK